jgi:hypothetical protein
VSACACEATDACEEVGDVCVFVCVLMYVCIFPFLCACASACACESLVYVCVYDMCSLVCVCVYARVSPPMRVKRLDTPAPVFGGKYLQC